ncbi:TetR/AcrR family transcriptional regulator C-terminal domain-containing protein [Nocardioides sp. SYSU D00038]|uniref:TetR/AcrR family transcriptional regulator C-terminal domain-containing protein n=1 Tax=Nocardioides sp. SYSU D00038 TaxID=2812554 RepID=UPI001966FF21|nr:TetR/AcrR family transcriptional regulator C-terminal domain-containing protein [Nocardioides sp. SYSU D00038]
MGRPSTNLLSRDLIARRALEMYDAAGTAGFSLRKLAEQLGVKSPSLYNHIASQEDLVDAMHDVIQEEAEWVGLDPDDWRGSLAAHVRAYRRAYAAHPEVALLIARKPIVDSGLAWYDAQLRGFTELGLTSAEALRLSAAIDYLVFGSMALPYVEGFHLAVDDYRDDYPDLATALGSTPAEETNDEGFEWALQRLLDGIEHLVAPGAPDAS